MISDTQKGCIRSRAGTEGGVQGVAGGREHKHVAVI